MATNQSLYLQKIKDDVAYLQQDTTKLELVVDKLNTNLEKMTEFSNNISKLLAVHDTKLAFQDKQYADIITEIKLMRKESTDQHEKLSNRITKMEKWMWIVIGGSIVGGFVIETLIKFLAH